MEIYPLRFGVDADPANYSQPWKSDILAKRRGTTMEASNAPTVLHVRSNRKSLLNGWHLFHIGLEEPKFFPRPVF
jgi:hypothetical protein